MRRRLYFLLPDVASARAMFNELLLARIEERHIHFLAKRGVLPPDLPDATFLQKTDIVHGAEIGVVTGGLIGIVAGTAVVLFPPEGVTLQLATVLGTALVGALLGAWTSSLAATAVPNSKLKPFHGEIESGKVLLLVDVPFRRLEQLGQLMRSRHPEAMAGGVEPTIPAFP
jgi:hypothetical protein